MSDRPHMEWDHAVEHGNYETACPHCTTEFDENTDICPWCGESRTTPPTPEGEVDNAART
jgi:rRNA maturation endonuclease Nob1